jgi:hypothetical protein
MPIFQFTHNYLFTAQKPADLKNHPHGMADEAHFASNTQQLVAAYCVGHTSHITPHTHITPTAIGHEPTRRNT